MVTDEAKYLRAYFAFLGVDDSFESSLVGQEVNPDTDDTRMEEWVSSEIREELVQVYKEDIEKLQDMLGRDLSHWR